MAEETPASTTLIERLESIVTEHMNQEDFDVESFAQLAGCSRSDLYRKIKKATGKSVTHFVRDIRLDKALELLKDGHLTASQVAFEVGFNSATYFNKCFKEKYGFTPGETAYHPDEINELLGKRYAIKNNRQSNTRPYLIVLIVMAFLAVGAVGFFSSTENLNSVDPTTSGTPAILVVPLTNFNEDPEIAPIALGVTEEVIIAINDAKELGRAPHIRDVKHFKDSLLPLQELAKRFDAAFILQGSVQKVGAQFKVNVQCEPASSDMPPIWTLSVVMENDPDDPFKLQKEVARQVMEKLNFNGDNYYPDKWLVHTESELAEAYYREGMKQSLIGTKASWERAIELFQKAIDEDPGFTEAYVRLASEWASGGTIAGHMPQEEAWERSKPIFRKALKLDPDNKLALYQFKDFVFYSELNTNSDYPELAGVSFEDQLTYNTDFATKTGRFDKAHEGHLYYDQKYPATGLVDVLMAINLYFMKEEERAVEIMNKNYPIYKDDFYFLRESIKAYYFLGKDEEMEEALSYFLDKFEDRSPIIRWATAIVADRKNDMKTLQTQLDALLTSYEAGASGSPAWFFALYAAYKGDYEKCMDWLEKSYAAREVEMTWLAQEPDLAPLGTSMRYRALLDSIRFPQSARTHVINAGK